MRSGIAVLAALWLGFQGAVVGGVRVISREPQTSIPLANDTALGSDDLPMDEPPLARTVKGFQPEGIHITQWTHNSILVSWQTGREKIANNTDPPKPYDPSKVAPYVRYGTRPGKYSKKVKGRDSLVYTYVYGPEAGDTTYQSPILHHVLLKGLKPGKKYYYTVGNSKDGWSEELHFKTLEDEFPVRLGIIGDLGQTPNSSDTLQHLKKWKPEMVVITGDFSYADDIMSGDAGTAESFGEAPSSEQPRWDSWARLMQPLLSRLPLISTRGNHEIEPLLLSNNQTFKAANARYPLPQDPSKIDTAPNDASIYLNDSNPREFLNEASYRPSSSYYSVDLPGIAHFVSLNNYIPWGQTSRQYKWLMKDLAKVDRTKTPWLIVIFHVPPYHTYNAHYKESDTFMAYYEELFYEHQVDLVFNGHVHAYERTNPVYKYKKNNCAPMYTTIGDGGNIEGLYKAFINQPPIDAFCSNVSLFQLPTYQPTPHAETVITLQDGKFCPTEQPPWSAFRQPSFGYGILEIRSARKAVWQWHRNSDSGPVIADEAIILRGSRKCGKKERKTRLLLGTGTDHGSNGWPVATF